MLNVRLATSPHVRHPAVLERDFELSDDLMYGFAPVGLLSLISQYQPKLLSIAYVHPVWAAVLGGLLIGMGMLALFRHRASLGGATVLTLYLQEKRGWPAGKVQIGIDCTVVLLALCVIPPQRVGWSVLAAVVMGLFLWINHKPGRYAAT